VEFANQLCHQGIETGAVIIEASVLRLRPHPDDDNRDHSCGTSPGARPVAPAPQDVVTLAHLLEKYRREINPHFLNQYLLYKNLWHDQVRSRIPPLPCPSFVRRPVPSSVA
jgi:hypothetical protein